MHIRPFVAAMLSAVVVWGCSGGDTPAIETRAEAQSAPPAPSSASGTLYGLEVRTIDGRPQRLGAYAGKVLLIVNTASQCGFTPQYAGLEQLHRKYAARGFSVLGFPSNDFGGQEPGSDAEVLRFSQANYGVTFPLFSKSVVSGADAAPLYRLLAAKRGEPKWNFHKYLIDRKGDVIAAFPSDVSPDSPLLAQAIEGALGR